MLTSICGSRLASANGILIQARSLDRLGSAGCLIAVLSLETLTAICSEWSGVAAALLPSMSHARRLDVLPEARRSAVHALPSLSPLLRSPASSQHSVNRLKHATIAHGARTGSQSRVKCVG